MLGLRREERRTASLQDSQRGLRQNDEGNACLSPQEGKIETLYGVISTGKEANVFAGIDSEGKRIAVKIYRTYTTEFRRIWEYLAADPRIGYLPKDMRKLVFVWTRREFKNLQRAIKYAVRVPEPVIFRNNVLVMEFVGDETPAPRLKDVEKELSKEDFEGLYDFTMGL